MLLFICLTVNILFVPPASALDTGKIITNQCRQNLKMLKERTQKFLDENEDGLPMWASYDVVKSTLIGHNYFPDDPVSPTRDCVYNVVSVGGGDFQWVCNIHGVLDGEKTITFRYHEHRIIAKVSARYDSVPKYKDHVKDLYRWTNYSPTAMEKIKFYYNMNPLTTIILLIGGVLLMFFVYRNMA